MIPGPAAGALGAPRIMGRANFDFAPTAANQLPLRKGAVITIIQKGESGGWSKGQDESGQRTFLPNCNKIISSPILTLYFLLSITAI